MNAKPYLILLLGGFWLCISLTAFGQSSAKKPVIIAYVTARDWTPDDIEVQKLTHINYAFAVPTESGELSKASATDSINFAKLNALRAKNKDLKLLISVGGWAGCQYFSDVALTPKARDKFASSAVAFMKKYNLDGIDIDWEYPGQVGAGNIFRPEDKQNFTLLLKTLREKLNAQATKEGRKKSAYLLTAATGVDTAFVNHTELGKAAKYLDYVNIMTYDIYHGNDTQTGHHSALYQSAKGDHSRNSSADGVQGHIKAGVPAHKIVLGLPFYGRGWTEVNSQDNGLYQPSAGKHISLSFDSLAVAYINKNGFTRYWDEEAKAPYLWNPQSRTFISYADEESFIHKIKFVNSKGLAGVMFWEYTHDLKEKKLLNALYQGLYKKQQSTILRVHRIHSQPFLSKTASDTMETYAISPLYRMLHIQRLPPECISVAV